MFEVYFGDGVVSKAVSDGNIIILKAVVTNIDEANGASAFSASGAINTVTNITTTTTAIASGGATFYRNRVNTYIKQGMSKSEAEAKAFYKTQ